jgi:hypothetical protein
MGELIFPRDWRKEWNFFAVEEDLGLGIVVMLRKLVRTTSEALLEALLISTFL